LTLSGYFDDLLFPKALFRVDCQSILILFFFLAEILACLEIGFILVAYFFFFG